MIRNYFQWCSGATPLYTIPLFRSLFLLPPRTCIECSGRIGGLRSSLRWEGTPQPAAPLLGSHSLCREGTFQWLWRTLDGGRVHTTGLLSALPALGEPNKCLLPVWDAILLSESVLERAVMCHWNADLSVMSNAWTTCRKWSISFSIIKVLLFLHSEDRRIQYYALKAQPANLPRFSRVFRILGQHTRLVLEGISCNDTVGFRWHVPVYVNAVQMSLLNPEGPGSRWYCRQTNSRKSHTSWWFVSA